MDATFLILLLALFLTWLAWLAARQKTRMAAAEQATQQQRNSYTLEDWEDGRDRGFHVIGPDGTRLAPADLDWAQHGLMTTEVLAHGRGVEDAGNSEAAAGSGESTAGSGEFTAGARVELIPAGDAAGSVGVWNTRMTARAGDLPPDTARAVLALGADDAVGECLVLEERLAGDGRIALRLLLVRHDMLLDG